MISYTTNPVYTLKQNGASYDFDFYHNDHLATPQKLTNNAGTVSWAMENNAFGEVTIQTQTTTNNLRFPGQYADNEIGLNQNYYRDYFPHLGRYIETDPIGLDGGVNFYTYVYMNPIVYYDQNGNLVQAAPVVLGGLIIIGVTVTYYALRCSVEKLVTIIYETRPLDNVKDHCTDLYVKCIHQGWGGDWNCGQCHFYCTGINQEWPFHHCSPSKRRRY